MSPSSRFYLHLNFRQDALGVSSNFRTYTTRNQNRPGGCERREICMRFQYKNQLSILFQELIPSSYRLMNEGMKVLVAGLFEFASSTFPEFRTLQKAEKVGCRRLSISTKTTFIVAAHSQLSSILLFYGRFVEVIEKIRKAI